MNACEQADRLSAYHDGEMPPEAPRPSSGILANAPAARRSWSDSGG